ncbi:MAG: PQQ-like beta-propeller repeat protein [Anaerolineales bacterium]|nr:PQQ-like beta-propeller repeat protein [Anaerolineales bacterium]
MSRRLILLLVIIALPVVLLCAGKVWAQPPSMLSPVTESERTAYAPITGTWELADTVWPTFAHDFQRTGRSPLVGITQSHVIETWRGYTSQASAYSVGLNHTLFVKNVSQTDIFDLATHQVLGELTGGGCASTPTHMSNGYIFYGDEFTDVAYDPQWQIVWQFFHSGGCLQISPVMAPDGTLYFPIGSIGGSALLAADALTGNILWSYPLSVHGPGGLALGEDGTIYANTHSGLHAVNPDGSRKWYLNDIGNGTMSSSIGSDGTIYTVSDDRLTALLPDGTPLWHFAYPDRLCSYRAMAISPDGTIYLPTIKQNLSDPAAHFYAVNPDGSMKWVFSRPVPGDHGFCNSPVVDSLNNVIICADDGACYALNPEGELLWTYEVHPDFDIREQPILAEDGVVYIRSINFTIRLEGLNLDRQLFVPLTVRD